MFEVAGLPDYERATTLLERTIREKGVTIPTHPTYEEWVAGRYPLRNVMNGGAASVTQIVRGRLR